MPEDFFSDPDGTREQILAATYRTLRERGYANLTINAIGEEFEKSPSLVYRHYDGKDELVLECLQYMLDGFRGQLTSEEITDPRERLESFVLWSLDDELDDDLQRFVATLLELRSRAAHDEDYRRHFARSDATFVEYAADIIRAGIEQGEFRECDPDQVAETLVAILSGVTFRRSTTDSDDWVERVRDELESYLESRVYNP